MTKRSIRCTGLLITMLALSIAIAQAQTTSPPASDTASQATINSESLFSGLLAQAQSSRRWSFSLTPSSSRTRANASSSNIAPAASGPNLPVFGGGTLGRLTKWTGFTSSNSFIGDTTIFEDKHGLVGIGTDTPTSPLTVAGMVQSTSGGFEFPDGTVQTTSSAVAILTVAHNMTLTGTGTSASPLGVASPLMVRDLDNPARQPLQFETGCTSITTAGCNLDLPASLIPAGKRLVIEYVSMLAGTDDVGQVVFLEVSTSAGGSRVFHNFPPSPPTVGHYSFAVNGALTSIGQQVRLYADSGSVVNLNALASVPVQVLFTVSGYLVDIP